MESKIQMAIREKNRNVMILNKVIKIKECTKKWFRMLSVFFLVASVATVVSMINIEYCHAHPDEHHKQHRYLVTSIDIVTDMHYKSYSSMGTVTSTSNGSNSNNQSNNNENDDDDTMILTTIGGEDAKKIVTELEIGNGIQFSVHKDSNGNIVVVELVKAPELGKEFNNNKNLISTI